MKTTATRDIKLKQASDKDFIVDPESLFAVMKESLRRFAGLFHMTAISH